MLWSIFTCQIKEFANHIAGSSLELIEVNCFFFKLTTNQVLVFDWIAGTTQVNSRKYKRGFIFRTLSVARRGQTGILRKLYSLNSQGFLCSGGNRFGKCAYFAGFNRV